MMRVHVDGAWQDVAARGLDDRPCGDHLVGLEEGRDAPLADGHVASASPGRRHHGAAAHDEIELGRAAGHGRPRRYVTEAAAASWTWRSPLTTYWQNQSAIIGAMTAPYCAYAA